VIWLWLGLGIPAGALALLALAAFLCYRSWLARFLPKIVRIFQEKPLFIIPRGQPVPYAEEAHFLTQDGLQLVGCYLKGQGPRKGVILFGVEFGSNRWSCIPYCERLLAEGFDVFSFEFRSQGESGRQQGYEPIQWVTHFEVLDMQAALGYLKGRVDADPRGVGFFGISKGGTAGLMAAAREPYVRCLVTDGIFATYSTMVPYMRKWVSIYSNRRNLQALMPSWFYGLFGSAALNQISRTNGCRFPHLERAIPRLGPRPFLMIHGGADTYIKPDMALALFARAREPKELWLVEGAKHNQALHVAGVEYQQRVLSFFSTHLASGDDSSARPLKKNEPVADSRPARFGQASERSAASIAQPSLLDAH
jgi:pimeloyl-ACP methyl ester carboxylesterase